MKLSGSFERQLTDWGLGLNVEAKKLLVSYAHLLSRYEKANVIGTMDFG